MPSVVHSECQKYARYAEKCLILSVYLLCGIMLSIVIRSVIMASVVIMNVVAPSEHVRLKAESRDCRGSHSILQNFYERKQVS